MIEEVYKKALEMLKTEYLEVKPDFAESLKDSKIKLSKANYRIEYKGFELVFNESNDGYGGGKGYERFIKLKK
jgi:hypothetical protein